MRGFLLRVAETHGSASAKKAKSVLHGVMGYAVDNGVLSSDATGQVRAVTSTATKSKERGAPTVESEFGVCSRTLNLSNCVNLLGAVQGSDGYPTSWPTEPWSGQTHQT